MTSTGHPRDWMKVCPEGLYCQPANCFIDPVRPVRRAIITHGHADHARPGHQTVWATPQTLQIMQCRYGNDHSENPVAMPYGKRIELGDDVWFWLAPAGHILGSAQAVLEFNGQRIVISGDYKRSADPTCTPFQVIPCDVFVTEATFALPVFKHPPISVEVQKLLASLELFPSRCHMVGVYALGKCQRLILALREAGYHRTIYLHGALIKLCELYESAGIDLGPWESVSGTDKSSFAGEIVLAPPSALNDRWSRAFPDVLTCMASGWMQIRARSRQRRVELPLIISDHCDWPELLQTLDEVKAPEVWVTHGREEALVHAAKQRGFAAQALSLLGYEDEENT